MLFLRRAATLASSAKDTPRGGIGFPERLMLVALALESLPVQERKKGRPVTAVLIATNEKQPKAR